jgi:hypothetical protein
VEEVATVREGEGGEEGKKRGREKRRKEKEKIGGEKAIGTTEGYES